MNVEPARIGDADVNPAFVAGRASVVSMVADATRRARLVFDASNEMHPGVRAAAEHRFDEIRSRSIDLERDTRPTIS